MIVSEEMRDLLRNYSTTEVSGKTNLTPAKVSSLRKRAGIPNPYQYGKGFKGSSRKRIEQLLSITNDATVAKIVHRSRERIRQIRYHSGIPNPLYRVQNMCGVDDNYYLKIKFLLERGEDNITRMSRLIGKSYSYTAKIIKDTGLEVKGNAIKCKKCSFVELLRLLKTDKTCREIAEILKVHPMSVIRHAQTLKKLGLIPNEHRINVYWRKRKGKENENKK